MCRKALCPIDTIVFGELLCLLKSTTPVVQHAGHILFCERQKDEPARNCAAQFQPSGIRFIYSLLRTTVKNDTENNETVHSVLISGARLKMHYI